MNRTIAARLGRDRPTIHAPMAGIPLPRIAAASRLQICTRWRAFEVHTVHCAVVRAPGKLEGYA